MTQAEKEAQRLVERFSLVGLQQREEGLKCAIIFCEEMVMELGSILHAEDPLLGHWKRVKIEVEKL